jgi:hypothetical protein
MHPCLNGIRTTDHSVEALQGHINFKTGMTIKWIKIYGEVDEL